MLVNGNVKKHNSVKSCYLGLQEGDSDAIPTSSVLILQLNGYQLRVSGMQVIVAANHMDILDLFLLCRLAGRPMEKLFDTR